MVWARSFWLLIFVSTATQLDARLRREIYVWQRQPGPEVFAAGAALRDETEGFAFLAAEIRWRGREPELVEVPLDYQRIGALSRPTGLVLRIGPYSGMFGADDEVARYLCTEVKRLVAGASAAGFQPAELQVDFDCATANLDGYRQWLLALKASVPPLKLTFTALPDWLRSAAFPDLARSADGYVLQVHSLEKPRRPDATFTLCEPGRARAWIAAADKVGVPFRVALPTYGYKVGFTAQGDFIGLKAESEGSTWPAGTQIRAVRSDAIALAALVGDLEASALRHCVGVIWFRLPVPGDQLNWALPTLLALLRGNVPSSHLEVAVAWIQSGVVEVRVCNRGERDESLPATVRLRWDSTDMPQGADGIGGYTVSTPNPGEDEMLLRASPLLMERRLAPGGVRKIGWLRFSHELPLHLTLSSPP